MPIQRPSTTTRKHKQANTLQWEKEQQAITTRTLNFHSQEHFSPPGSCTSEETPVFRSDPGTEERRCIPKMTSLSQRTCLKYKQQIWYTITLDTTDKKHFRFFRLVTIRQSRIWLIYEYVFTMKRFIPAITTWRSWQNNAINRITWKQVNWLTKV